MHGIYTMKEGELRMALVQARSRECSAVAARLERELERRFAPFVLRAHA